MSKFNLIIEPVELLILKVVAVILLANAILIIKIDPLVDWWSYGLLTLIVAGCFLGSQIYRISGRSPRIGLALICTGISPLFSWSIIMFNYLLMPTSRPPIDETLIWFDGLYGFYWPDYMAWGAANPIISEILGLAYQSSMAQMGVLIIVLGLTGQQRQLHVMMLSIVITSVLAVFIWALFPNHGANSIYTLAPGIEEIVQPPVSVEYARELIRMAAEGPGLISPLNVKGLIGFPSYHIVLALTSAYFMRGVRGLFPVFVVLNILVAIATPLHGGHHMADILGGVALFIFGTIMAERLVLNMYKKDGHSATLAGEFAQPAAV